MQYNILSFSATFIYHSRTLITRLVVARVAQSVSGSYCRMSPQFATAGEIPESPLIELTGAAPCKKLLSVSLCVCGHDHGVWALVFHCVCTCCSCRKLLECFVLEVCHYLQPELPSLWRLLCGMIKGPNLDLKKVNVIKRTVVFSEKGVVNWVQSFFG